MACNWVRHYLEDELPQEQCTMFRMPVEIRVMILRHLLATNSGLFEIRGLSGFPQNDTIRNGLSPVILRVCQRLWSEGRNILFEENILRIVISCEPGHNTFGRPFHGDISGQFRLHYQFSSLLSLDVFYAMTCFKTVEVHMNLPRPQYNMGVYNAVHTLIQYLRGNLRSAAVLVSVSENSCVNDGTKFLAYLRVLRLLDCTSLSVSPRNENHAPIVMQSIEDAAKSIAENRIVVDQRLRMQAFNQAVRIKVPLIRGENWWASPIDMEDREGLSMIVNDDPRLVDYHVGEARRSIPMFYSTYRMRLIRQQEEMLRALDAQFHEVLAQINTL